ncbi:hypothetical protein [Streptomyces sp. Je 1-369]|uniref:hypothetical protein n=1 Tax=Streptomyces sp. Je 1-369 TaxID=2966192 RepID=UPI002285BE21|nr:hypothetical protein [Streptomyces sp. Je 1-369]WAL97186.1 hypothetical protein NOO62_23445 [Streptomyces sp. Je 1-369]
MPADHPIPDGPSAEPADYAEPVDSAESAVELPPTGYRVLLPSEWAQIPLRHGTEDAVRRILDEAYARIPADAPRDKITPYKRELERRFRASVAEAQRGKGLDLYLPVKPMGDFNVGASILVSEAVVPRRPGQPPSTSEPTEVAVQLLSRDGRDGVADADLSSGEIDGALAVRREHIADAAPDKGAELASRRVEYILSVPADPDRWFVAAFSTVGGGDPRDELAEALVEWFDAVMANFRWSRP